LTTYIRFLKSSLRLFVKLLLYNHIEHIILISTC